MKKVFEYITAAFMAVLLAASCDKNLEPVFDDANAFIAFSSKTYTLPEDGTLRIPVSLASVSGLEGSATFTIKEDKSSKKRPPVEGTDYKVNTVGGTLKFDAENRTSYIELEGIVNGSYTGDMSFLIELSTTLKLGSNSECKVTISDIDHPLTPMLGDYTVSGDDYWDGASTWSLTLSKDKDDAQKVWLSDLVNMGPTWAATLGSVYGIVDDEMKTIEIPLDQTLNPYSGYKMMFYGFDAAADDYVKSGKTKVEIVWQGGAVTGLNFEPDMGFYVGTDDYTILGITTGNLAATKN